MPFDAVKTRLQHMHVVSGGAQNYSGIVDCASYIARNEGILGFWRGFTAYYLRCAPHTMLVLLTRDAIMDAYDGMFSSA